MYLMEIALSKKSPVLPGVGHSLLLLFLLFIHLVCVLFLRSVSVLNYYIEKDDSKGHFY